MIDDSRGANYNRYDNNSHDGDDDEEDNYDDNGDDDNGYDDCGEIHDNENKIYENNDGYDDICHKVTSIQCISYYHHH